MRRKSYVPRLQNGACVAVSTLVLLVLSCAGTPRPPQETGASTTRAEGSEGTGASTTRAEGSEDAQARRARELSEEVYRHPPPMPSRASKDEVGAFLNGPLKDWFVATKERIAAAASAYEEARVRANPHPASEYALVTARLYMFLIQGLVEAGKAAMPAEWAADEQISSAYVGALHDSVAPFVERALAAVDACLSIAERAVVKPPKEPECRQLVQRDQKADRLKELQGEVPAHAVGWAVLRYCCDRPVPLGFPDGGRAIAPGCGRPADE